MEGLRPALTASRVAFWVVMAVWGGVEIRTSIVRGGQDTGEDAGSRRWSLGATLGGLATALVLDSALPEIVPEVSHTPFLVTGSLVVAAGIVLRIWAIRTLGRFFTYQVMTTADQVVIDHGPYRFVRHPSYTGLLVSCLGAGIATANPLALIAALTIPLVGLAKRIHVEEAALGSRLGPAYERYCAGRKRLVPGVW